MRGAKALLFLLSLISPRLGLSAVQPFFGFLPVALPAKSSTSSRFPVGKAKHHVLRMSAPSESTSSPPFVLKPSETALVLIEYQNEFTTEGGKLHGAVKEVMERTQMLPNSARMTDAARQTGCTIIHCPISFEPVSPPCTPPLESLRCSPLTLGACSAAADHDVARATTRSASTLTASLPASATARPSPPVIGGPTFAPT
jgi:hypothetical protein